jgi:mannan endo-1,4-beta-mannosidase
MICPFIWAGLQVQAQSVLEDFSEPTNSAIDLTPGPSDSNISPQGLALWSRLRSLSRQDRFAFGQQDAILYGINANTNNTTWTTQNNTNQDRSDIKSLTGCHPMVFGFDLAQPDTPLRQRVQDAYRWGGIITFSWHRLTIWYNGQWVEPTLASVQPGGTHHDALVAHLDELANWMNTLMDDDDQPIPFIFRPWHEFTGGWFWWSAAKTSQSKTQFINLFQLTVDYLRNAGCHSFLTALSPCGHRLGVDRTFFFAYPGDDYVDIYTVDQYFAADRDFQDQGGPLPVDKKEFFAPAVFWNAVSITAQAVIDKENAGIEKLLAISEFGAPEGIWSNQQNITDYTAAHYYKELFLDGMVANLPLEKRRRITYAMTWRNSSKTHGWIPVANHPGAQDFIAFANSSRVQLLGWVGDFNQDRRVDLEDFAILAAQWLSTPGDPSADIAPRILDDDVNSEDIFLFLENWLSSVN